MNLSLASIYTGASCHPLKTVQVTAVFVLFCFLHLLGTGVRAFLVFGHLLLTRTQPAPTMTEQARLKASIYLLSDFASCILSQLKVNLCPQFSWQQKFLTVGASPRCQEEVTADRYALVAAAPLRIAHLVSSLDAQRELDGIKACLL